MGILVSPSSAGHFSREGAHGRVHGWRPRTQAEERRLHEEQLAKLLRAKELRQRISVHPMDACDVVTQEQCATTAARDILDDTSSEHHAESPTDVVVESLPHPSFTSTSEPVPERAVANVQHESATSHPHTSSRSFIRNNFTEDACDQPTPASGSQHIPAVEPVSVLKAAASRGKVAETMEKVAVAKKKAKYRISGGSPTYPSDPIVLSLHKKQWVAKPTSLMRESSKLRCIAQEEAAFRTLHQIYDRKEAKEAAERQAEEARRLAEEEEAREKQRAKDMETSFARTTWQYYFVDKIDEEETRASEVHVYREGLLTEFWRYEEKWKLLKKSSADDVHEWTCGEFPWPIQVTEAERLSAPVDISSPSLYNFILHPLRPGYDILSPAVRQKILREERLHWDPEQCMKLVIPKVVEADRTRVMEGVRQVYNTVCAMLKAEEDLF